MAPMPTPPQSVQLSNAQQRAIVTKNSVPMLQAITSQTVFPASNPLFNYQPRAVGLIRRFIVEVTATITNSGSTTLSLTDFGLANLIKNVQYTDLNNYVRINTTGMHLSMLASAKRRRPYGAADMGMVQNGNNVSQMLNVPAAAWPVFQAPATIPSGDSVTVRAVFEVPLAYSNDDLRGAIYANVINTQQNIQVIINPNPVVLNSADNTFAVYAGAAGSAGSCTSATITLYQDYLDQIPRDTQGNLILPTQDLSTVYLLNNTNFSAITQNQDYYIPYTNFRSFLSTFLVYNNSGTSAGRTFGTDLLYLEVQAANFSYPWKVDPLLAAQLSRDHLQFDLPAGCYYLPTRSHPIQTQQYGNFQAVINATTANAGAYVQAMWEQFAPLNTLVNAASLASS